MEKLNSKITSVRNWILKASKDEMDVSETMDQLRLSGSRISQGFSQWMEEGFDALGEAGALEMSSFQIDGKERKESDLPDLKKRRELREGEWRFSLNKGSWIKSFGMPDSSLVFFQESSLLKWLSDLDPFTVFPQAKRIRLYCPFFENSFGGNGFQLIGAKGPVDPVWMGLELPIEKDVREEVLITRSRILIRPALFQVVTWGPEGHAVNALLARNMFFTLVASLAREFEGPDKAVFRGELVKREYPLHGPDEERTERSLLVVLESTVHWVYDKTPSTRLALLADRLTIEMAQEKSLLQNLNSQLASALSKAKEDYVQVVRDRKTKYYKELGDLVKDIQVQAATYGKKIQSLTNNLLRDLLGSFILVVFDVVIKSQDKDLPPNPWILLLIGIYFLVSFFVQSYVNGKDLRFSDAELEYWQKSTRTALDQRKIKEKIDQVLNPRKAHYRSVNIIVGVFYGLITSVCILWAFRIGF